MKESHLIDSIDINDFSLACVACGSQTILSLLGQRNQYNSTTGFVLVCGMCAAKMGRMKMVIEVKDE